MTVGGISYRLVGFADVPVCHRTGGLGMDLVQFDAMIALKFTIGMATPPFCYTIVVGAAISGLHIRQIARALMPMPNVMIIVLLLVAFVTTLTLTIVEWLR
jgi:C4-dicarboxylate transporter DctM subunit